MKRSRIWLGLNVVMLVLFAFAAVVQYNDANPIRWMLMYGATAVACGLELARRGSWLVPAAVAVVAAVWAAVIAPAALEGNVQLGDLFTDARMLNPGVEEAREALGLLIVAVWTALLARSSRIRGRRHALDPSALSRSIR